MKLSVNGSSNLFFLPAAYDESYFTTKALAGRLRGLLIPCKEAYVLEALVEFPGPYLIDGKLQSIKSKIKDGGRNPNCSSILSVCWSNDNPVDGIASLQRVSPRETYINSTGASRFGEVANDAFDTSSLARRDYRNSHSSRTTNDAVRTYLNNNASSIDSTQLHMDISASLDYPHHEQNISHKSISDLGYRGFERGRASKVFSTVSSILETPLESDRDDQSEPLSFSTIHSLSPGLKSPRRFSFEDLRSKEFPTRNDTTVDEAHSQYRSETTFIQRHFNNHEITDSNRGALVSMCNLLRRMLMFVVDASSHELGARKLFDGVILEGIQLLEGIASEAFNLKKSSKEHLKRYTICYMESLKEYERASAKFMKLEKALEGAFMGRWNSGAERVTKSLELGCKFESCHCNDPSYKKHRINNGGIVKDLLSNSKDFILYTNYVEQLCISGYLHDSLIKNREKFTKDLTGVFSTFMEHYPTSVFSPETEFLSKISSVSSTLLKGSYYRAECMKKCYLAAINIPEEGVMDLRFSVNVRPTALIERLHATIVETFETMRTIAKKLARFHLSQADRFERYISRSPCMFCNVDLNILWRAYKKYHKHLHNIWWSMSSTIHTVFPKTPATLRRFKDLQQPVLGEFREVKLPLNLFNTVLRQFEAVIRTSKEHSFNVCTASIQLCSERQSWSDFLFSLAINNKIDHSQLQNIAHHIQQSKGIQRNICLSFPSEGDETASVDTSKAADRREALIDLIEPVQTCEISKVLRKLLYVTEGMAEALADYNEYGYNFGFKKGEAIHVCIVGNTPLWFGHTASGVDRWFPAKYVKLKEDAGMSLFRVADIECDTYLDGYKISDNAESQQTNKQDKVFTLSSKALLKQSLVLSKLGLQGKVEYEFKCSICRKIVLRGTLYLTKTHLGFISSFNDVTLFGNETTLTIPMKDIVLCELTSGKRISFYVRIKLRNGDNHVLHTVTSARRIRDAINELAGIEECESQEIVSADSIDSSVCMSTLKEFFGVIEPLSKEAPSITLQISLKDFFIRNLSDNITEGCLIADSRLSQNATDFSGNLEPVEFDWNRGGIQFHRRVINYSFTLKEGKFTSLIPRHTCGKAREEIKYALVNQSQVVYESTNYVSEVPYAKYFYTVIRITATALSSTRTVVKAEYDVKFVKSTMFASVITAEACDRLLNSVHIICADASTEGEPQEQRNNKTQQMPVEQKTSESPINSMGYGLHVVPVLPPVSLKSFICLCLILVITYTNLMSNLD